MKTNHEKKIFNARLLHAADGDTVTLLIALGLGVHVERRVRLAGIDAHELASEQRTSALHAARIIELHCGGTPLLFELTLKHPDRYGRLIGKITTPTGDLAHWLCLNQLAWPRLRTATVLPTEIPPTPQKQEVSSVSTK